MRAYSMDLERGSTCDAGRPRQCLLGAAARSRPAPAAVRAASGARVPAAQSADRTAPSPTYRSPWVRPPVWRRFGGP